VAARRALELMEKHGLTASDLESSGKTAAFDKIVDALGEYSSKHPDLASNTFGAAQIVGDVLLHAKRNLPQGRKVVLVDQLSRGIKIAKMLLGDNNHTLNDISGIVDTILKNHQV
jgi:hypothetical protein